MSKYILPISIITIFIVAGAAFYHGFKAMAASTAASNPPLAPDPSGKGDLPIKGEHFTVVIKDDTRLAAVDAGSIQDESDGSVSIKFLFFNKHEDGSTSQSSGRLAFKCHAQQWRMQSFYDLDAQGAPLGAARGADEYDAIAINSAVADIEKVACHPTQPGNPTI
jgi:hypothetical protein